MAELALIAAVARNGVIGDRGRLPWHLPEDLQHFRRTTLGHPVVMGRRTWESVPDRFRPLPGRRNIVVTRDATWHAEGAQRAGSPAEALALAGTGERAFVIGGVALFAAALPLADALFLTELDADFDGDTRFPPFDRTRFVETARTTQRAAPPNDFDVSFVTYVRQR